MHLYARSVCRYNQNNTPRVCEYEKILDNKLEHQDHSKDFLVVMEKKKKRTAKLNSNGSATIMIKSIF